MISPPRISLVLLFWSCIAPALATPDNALTESAQTPPTSSIATNAETPATYFLRHSEGWFWYQDPTEAAEEPKEPEPPATSGTMVIEEDPLEELKRFHQTLERAEARAVLHPTEENLLEYLRLNYWAQEQASLFSAQWRQVLRTTPSLDFSLRRPTQALAVNVHHDQRRAARAATVAKIARTHGLFFFFRSECPYCHAFAPVLRQLSEQYGVEVLPISLDGGSLPDFPQPRVDTRIAAQLGVETVPSVFLVDPQGRDVIPLGAGAMSLEELLERIYDTQTPAGEDY